MKEIKDNKLKIGKGITVLMFCSELCSACPKVEHDLKLFAKESSAQFFKLKREHNAEVAISFDIMGFPTVLIIDNGKEVKRYVGSSAGTNTKKFLTK